MPQYWVRVRGQGTYSLDGRAVVEAASKEKAKRAVSEMSHRSFKWDTDLDVHPLDDFEILEVERQ